MATKSSRKRLRRTAAVPAAGIAVALAAGTAFAVAEMTSSGSVG